MSMNRLRSLYAAGRPAIDTFFNAGNAAMMECLGFTGLDFAIFTEAYKREVSAIRDGLTR